MFSHGKNVLFKLSMQMLACWGSSRKKLEISFFSNPWRNIPGKLENLLEVLETEEQLACQFVVSDKTSVKSCIKAAAYVQFFNFLVRLLFKCGFYLRAAYMQSPESAKPEKAAWHM